MPNDGAVVLAAFHFLDFGIRKRQSPINAHIFGFKWRFGSLHQHKAFEFYAFCCLWLSNQTLVYLIACRYRYPLLRDSK